MLHGPVVLERGVALTRSASITLSSEITTRSILAAKQKSALHFLKMTSGLSAPHRKEQSEAFKSNGALRRARRLAFVLEMNFAPARTVGAADFAFVEF